MQKHISIGIAGHVDHGKTSLVKALTGIDTDRLQEEKRRGLSIDSGIAPMELSSGTQVALMDVPGHISFLKNTVRGLCGVDAAVLVVAADDGIMPQTIEHLEVLRFFGARTRLVVLTKADLVDDETIELAELEVREMLEGISSEPVPVIPFSNVDHRGLDRIKAEIEGMADTVPGKDPQAPFRCWIDRVKGFSGFGTVASGTVFSGIIGENDPIEILPSGSRSRARSLESHHVKQARLYAGQRAGINLHKVGVDKVARGMLLSEPGLITPGFLLNVSIRMLPGTGAPLKNRQKVKLYLGTSITIAMVVLIGEETLTPGREGLAQLRLMRPLAGLPQDPFVITLLNIQSIIGGGTVLETPKEKYRPSKASRLVPRLQALNARGLSQFLNHLVELEINDKLILPEDIAFQTGFPLKEIQRELEERLAEGELLSFGSQGFFSRSRFKALKGLTISTLEGIFIEDPLKQTASYNEIRSKLSPSLDEPPFRRILDQLSNEGKLVRKDGGFMIPNRSAGISEEHEDLISMLLEYARQSELVPIGAGSFCKLHRGRYNKNEVQRLLDHLHVQERMIRLNNRRFMLPETMARIRTRVKSLIERKGVLKISDCKEIFGYGRTVGIPVLEYLDSIGFTVWDGEQRRLGQEK